MHRNERYFDKNEGKHNHFGQWDDGDAKADLNNTLPKRPKATSEHQKNSPKNKP